MFDLITTAQMFIYTCSAYFVCEGVFLCADKQSSVRFAYVLYFHMHINANVPSCSI